MKSKYIVFKLVDVCLENIHREKIVVTVEEEFGHSFDSYDAVLEWLEEHCSLFVKYVIKKVYMG